MLRVLPLALVLAVACRNEDKADLDGDGVIAMDDCDDSNAAMAPDQPEVCDGYDNDCDGLVDEGDAEDAQTFWRDADGDGYGDPEDSVSACEQPEGYVSDDTDCDDTQDDSHPGAVEVCDGLDNDCNGEADDAIGDVWFEDADGDGYGNRAVSSLSCDGGSGWVADDTDCDDDDPAVHPEADEVCNAKDDDCDGVVDEDTAVDAQTWYPDLDGDSYGDPAYGALACDPGDGWTLDGSDCDDSDATNHPGAAEVCDGDDDDCDGLVDEDDAADAPTWYIDYDGDGFGSSSYSVTQCEQPEGYVDNDDDCDDAHTAANPIGTEVCDGLDNDCDGSTDGTDAADVATWYADRDGDGYGDAADSSTACDQPSGYVSNDLDCDDSESAYNPLATELCDEVDNDCDGSVDEDDAADAPTWYIDYDGDGYGVSDYTLTQCEQPSGYVDNDDDCDDTDDTYSPETVWYVDADGDGYGNPDYSKEQCEEPSGWLLVADDCDDTDASVSPAGTEVCNGVDDDCDGEIDDPDELTYTTYYLDADGDGYGDADDSLSACAQPSGYVTDDTDCQDDDDTAYPGSTTTEVPYDGVDQDCDGNDYCTDIDCDGLPDIVFSDYRQSRNDYSLSSYIYYGASSYSTSDRTGQSGQGVLHHVVADLDGDGYQDVVYANHYNYSGDYSRNSYIYWGSASGFSTTTALPTLGAYHVTADDLDGNGYADLVFSNYRSDSNDRTISSYIYWGSSSGYSTSDRTSLRTNGALHHIVEDLDADGYDDIVFCDYRDNSSYSTSSYIYWGSSTGYSSSDRTALPTTGCRQVQAADIDADGYTDLVFASHYDGNYSTYSRIYWGSSTGFSSSDYTNLPTYGTYAVDTADLDGDGQLEVVLPNYYDGSSYDVGVYIYWSSDSWGTTDRTTLSMYGGRDVEIDDLDGDGYQDIVAVSYTDGNQNTTSYIFWGSASGYSDSDRTGMQSYGGTALAIGDLDGDGLKEVVHANYSDGDNDFSTNSYIFWGSSSWSGSSRSSLPTYGAYFVTITGTEPTL